MTDSERLKEIEDRNAGNNFWALSSGEHQNDLYLLLEIAERQQKEIERLQDQLFETGAMNTAPCFVCGYNGPSYFSPEIHKCAERHHRLWLSPLLD